MIPAPEWEKEIGIFWYLTEFPGSGGRIKERPEDFIVEEEGALGRARVSVLLGGKASGRPEGEGEHLWVVLEKRDWDTMDVLGRLARALGISVRRISFAGTKDKRAITAQWISLQGVRWKELSAVSLKDVAVHTPVYMRKKIRLGELYGNWFEVRIRGARGPLSVPPEFPNYFGHQRFGSYRFVSHLVGRRIVQGDFEGAVWEYLTRTSPWEPEETRRARETLRREGDFREALRYFPRRLRLERRILSLLASGKSAEGAIRALHKRTLSLFIHAYQAYLFNVILSRRMERGISPSDGDILCEGVPTGLVPGFRAELAGGEQGEIEREVLEEEGVNPGDFRRWKKFGAEGGRRKLVESAKHVRVSGSVVSFFLPKNTYATSLLREIMKPESPEGFLIPAQRQEA